MSYFYVSFWKKWCTMHLQEKMNIFAQMIKDTEQMSLEKLKM